MSVEFTSIDEAKACLSSMAGGGTWERIEETVQVSQTTMFGQEPDDAELAEMARQETWRHNRDNPPPEQAAAHEFTFAPFRAGWCAWLLLPNGMTIRVPQ